MTGAPVGILTPERILEAAEDVLRRYGPAKATVVDVARALDVSHGSVYRHFASKAALRDAVTERFLARIVSPLDHIATESKGGTAARRLRRWFDLLIAAKRRFATDDPELFATYVALAAESREVVHAHIEALVAQITIIIRDGIARREFTVTDASSAGRAVWDATMRFHHPAFAGEWSDAGADAAFDRVWTFILKGLGTSTGSRS